MERTSQTTHDARRLDRPTFLRGLGKLVASYSTRAGDRDEGKALTAAWWQVLGPPTEGDDARPWITVEVFERAVADILETSPRLPAPALALAYCQAARDDLIRERRRQLPPPPEPTDEERAERAARGATSIAEAWAYVQHKFHGVPLLTGAEAQEAHRRYRQERAAEAQSA